MQKVSAALIPFLLVLAMESVPASAQKNAAAPAAAELTQLLKEFLAAASTNDKAMFLQGTDPLIHLSVRPLFHRSIVCCLFNNKDTAII